MLTTLYGLLAVTMFAAAIFTQEILAGIFALYFAVVSVGYRIETAIKARS